MTTGIANPEKLEAAFRMFETMLNAFDPTKESQIDLFTFRGELTGTSVQLTALSTLSRVEKITGTRQWAQMRAYANAAAVWPYGPKGMRLSSVEINHDPIGILAQKIQDYFAGAGTMWEGPVFRALLSNPRSIDGVALLSASHPHGYLNANQNNLAAAITPAAIFNAYTGMTQLQTEDGDPLDVAPDTLMGGSKSIRVIRDFAGSDRYVPMSSAGAPDTTSSVVGVATKTNWAAGRFTPVEARRISAGGSGYDQSWFMLDTTNKTLAPMRLSAGAVVSAPVTEPSAEPMVQRSEVAYYLQAEGAILGAYWPTIAGYIA